jgi:hypothetical protein
VNRKKQHSRQLLADSSLFNWQSQSPSTLVPGHADIATVIRPYLLGKIDGLVRNLARLSLLRLSFTSIHHLTNDPFNRWALLFLTVKHSNLSVPNVVRLRTLQQIEFSARNVSLRNRIHMVSSQHSVSQLKVCINQYCYSLFREGTTNEDSHVYDEKNILVGIKIDPILVLKFLFKHRVVLESAQAGPLFRYLGIDADGSTERWTCDMVLRLDFFAVGSFTAKSMGCIGFTPQMSNSVNDNIYLMYLLCKDNSENNRIYAGPLLKVVEDMWDMGFSIAATDDHCAVSMVFMDAVCVADGKGITEIAQFGGAHQCSLCGSRFKVACLSLALHCVTCRNTYADLPSSTRLCNHIPLSATPPTTVPLHDDALEEPYDNDAESDVEGEDAAQFDDEAEKTMREDRRAERQDARAHADMLNDRYTDAGFPSVAEMQHRLSFEWCKGKAARVRLLTYTGKLDNYNFIDSTYHVPPNLLPKVPNLTTVGLDGSLKQWYKKNMVKVTTEDVNGDTVHSIEFDVTKMNNINRLGRTICVLLSSHVTEPGPEAAAIATIATTELSFENFEDSVLSFSDSETRHGDGMIDDLEHEKSSEEVRFNLLKRMVVALHSRHPIIVPIVGMQLATTAEIHPLLRDLTRILICFLHLRLRVSEKLIRQFIFAILESNLSKESKTQRLVAMEDFINETCSAKLSNVKYFHIKQEKQKKGGVSVKFNLQGNKLKVIWLNIADFIKIGMPDSDTIWGSLLNQKNFIELFTLYSGIIRQLSKSHKVAGKVVYDKLTIEEMITCQKDCDLMGALFIAMFGRKHKTGYLHWMFDGHCNECLRRYGFIKPFEGQSWEHGMGRSKGVIHNKSNMSGSKGDKGGMVDALMTNNMLTVVFLW